MKKLFLSLLIGTSALLANQDSDILKKIEQLPLVKAHKYTPMEVEKIGDMYFVKGYFNIPRTMRSQERKQYASMFLTKDMSLAIYGQGFNTQNGQAIKTFSTEEAKKVASFSYGNGKDEYFLIVDPLCPICMDFDQTLPKYKEDMKLYFIFMPLKRLHPDAPKAIAYILSQKTDKEKFDALQKISHGNKDYLKLKNISKDINNSIERQEILAQQMGATGTPTLYVEDGTKVRRDIIEYRHNQYEKVKKEKK